MVEKFLAAGTAIWLLVLARIDVTTLAPFLVDVFLGFLFIASYVRSSERSSRVPVRHAKKPNRHRCTGSPAPRQDVELLRAISINEGGSRETLSWRFVRAH